MSFVRRHASLVLALWIAVAPALTTGCSAVSPDKRILQYLNKEGFGKRYVGNSQEQNYISIGDAVTYFDALNPDILRGVERVDVDGTIQLPEVGAVWIAGLSREEAEVLLNQKLSAYFVETEIKVAIASGAAKVYYVIGEVEAAGPKPYLGDTTIFDAVLQAQPTEYTANLGRVRLIRADPRDPLVMMVDVSRLWEAGDSTYNVQVQEYDIIYVPPTFMKQLADVASGIVVPVTTVLRSVLGVIFQFQFQNGNRFNRVI